MSGVNNAVVRASGEELGYGAAFSYDERAQASSPFTALRASLGLRVFALLTLSSPGRWLINRVFPTSARASDEQVERGSYESCFLGWEA
eukprot:CAMPEP_0184680262 /NCGR_PEP_ID=MMETSP0312-20130426/3134_1 /TAXON_ID=31354 /ORGANISM="Compsopogon coeruleus, Strain SAG 36.94" /LENGTH=88 /DNA_ID=CAMNT_0027130243 /DNA_START=1 /DNA_END=264 /DNA_ORIENTATION=+